MKDITLTEIAEILGCDPSDYTSDTHVHGLTTLCDATPETLSFVTGEKFLQEARETQAAGLVVPKGVDIEGKITFPVEDVWERVVNLLRLFYPRPSPTLQIHPSAIVNDGACFGKEISIGANVQIGNNTRAGDNVVIESNCYIGSNVIIGDDTYICPNVTILNDVTIGSRVIIHPGAVIGSDGFKYEIVRGELAKIPQVGSVIIEDDVEIGANTCIDRASFTATRIGQGTKIDNLVQIAHNVEIGRNCMLAAQVGIAGSTKIGDNVRMAGQAGVVDNVSVGDGATIGAKSAVTKLVRPGQFVWGIPAVPIDQFKKSYAALRRLSKTYDARKKKKTD